MKPKPTKAPPTKAEPTTDMVVEAERALERAWSDETKHNDVPPLTPDEIRVLRRWVQDDRDKRGDQ